MQRPIIIEGQPFDWKEGEKNMLNAVDESGEVNWFAAMNADPGVMQCPKCQHGYGEKARRFDAQNAMLFLA